MAFNIAGNYTVTENVTDSAGGMNTSNLVKIKVNPPLESQTPLYSLAKAYQGQLETISAQATGGTPPYAFAFVVTNTINGNVIITYSANGIAAGQDVSFTYNTLTGVPNLKDELGTLLTTLHVTDSVNNTVGVFDNYEVEPQIGSNITSSVQTPDIGQPILFTAQTSGGYTPYTYNFTVVNSTGAVIGGGNVVSIQANAELSYTPGKDAVGYDNVYVTIRDNLSESELLHTNISVQNATYVAPAQTSNGGGGGGGGSSGGGSGGGGGSFMPTVINQASASTILNFSQDNSERVTVMNKTFTVIENYITPTTAGVTIGNTEYELNVNQAGSIGTFNGIAYNVTLTGISYIPIAQTVTVRVSGSKLPQAILAATKPIVTVVSTATTTFKTTTVAPPNRQAAFEQPASPPSNGYMSILGITAANSLFLYGILAVAIILLVLSYAYLHSRTQNSQSRSIRKNKYR